ncbi:MAG: extracellular solute-binding protein [Clostridia bacterium]|nr:extracellular solute-binding protein [Clostridia bacterium]
MNKIKRVLAAILAATLSLGVLTSCGKDKVKPVSEDGLELTIFMHFFNYCVYNDEWPIFKKAAELTGVTLKGTASETVSDSSQAFNTMLASQTLPDIIHSSFTNLNEIGEEGALIPLEDLIDEYAPNIKKMFEKYPQLKKRATASDGHIYYIPGSTSGLEADALPSLGWFIRQDWLDKLGLKQPTTIEELEAVWTAFRNNDPNGNGIQDEVPFFSRVGGLSSLFHLFKTDESGYMLDEKTGKIVYAPITPEFKTAVKKIAEWYKNGLIDEEVFTRGGQCREQLLGGNLGGSTHDWFSSTCIDLIVSTYLSHVASTSAAPIIHFCLCSLAYVLILLLYLAFISSSSAVNTSYSVCFLHQPLSLYISQASCASLVIPCFSASKSLITPVST